MCNLRTGPYTADYEKEEDRLLLLRESTLALLGAYLKGASPSHEQQACKAWFAIYPEVTSAHRAAYKGPLCSPTSSCTEDHLDSPAVTPTRSQRGSWAQQVL